jgi:hypothetical protein
MVKLLGCISISKTRSVKSAEVLDATRYHFSAIHPLRTFVLSLHDGATTSKRRQIVDCNICQLGSSHVVVTAIQSASSDAGGRRQTYHEQKSPKPFAWDSAVVLFRHYACGRRVPFGKNSMGTESSGQSR